MKHVEFQRVRFPGRTVAYVSLCIVKGRGEETEGKKPQFGSGQVLTFNHLIFTSSVQDD